MAGIESVQAAIIGLWEAAGDYTHVNHAKDPRALANDSGNHNFWFAPPYEINPSMDYSIDSSGYEWHFIVSMWFAGDGPDNSATFQRLAIDIPLLTRLINLQSGWATDIHKLRIVEITTERVSGQLVRVDFDFVAETDQ